MPPSSPPDEPDLRPARRLVSELIIVGTIAALFLGGLVYWVVSAGRPTTERSVLSSKSGSGRMADFVGDRACRECHPGETAAHSRSGHSKTLRPAAKLELAKTLDGQRFPDPEQPGVTWSYALRDGQLRVQRASGDQTQQLAIDYAFGSGNHAVTFFSLIDPDPRHTDGLEHRITYYAATQSLGVTPGQKAGESQDELTPMGARNPAADTVLCFGCHTTVTSAQDPNVLDLATMVPNVSCERCHGFGRAHVDAARRGAEKLAMAFGPGRATATKQMQLCGQCHRYPGVLPGTGAFQVAPADIRPDNPKITRFQPIGLMQSACFTKSQGALTCTTCHDPHARTSKDAAAYEAICLSCHQAPSHTVCLVSPAMACLKCHMPPRDSGQGGILFTDHWIRVHNKD